MRTISFSAFVALFLSGAAPAAAYDVPGIEAFFGASNIVATTGNGRLTAAVSPEGDLSVLSWPSPTYYDHLQYISSNAPNVRNVPRAGALDGMGVFAGLVLEDSTGTRTVTWLNDGTQWSWTVAYSAVDSTVVVTTFEHRTLGVEVVQRDFVGTDSDVLYRDYQVDVGSADVTDAWLLGYSNLSPSQTKLEQMPIADFAFEQHQDFAAVWDDPTQAVVHFHPADNGTMTSPLGIARVADNMRRDFGSLGALLTSTMVDDSALQAVTAGLDAEFGEGVYVAHSATPAPDQFQIGYDTTPVCEQIDGLADTIAALLDEGENPGFTIPSSVVGVLRCGTFDPLATPRSENGWTHDAEDALLDAADGELSGSRVAAAQVNTALRVPLQLTGGVGRATLHYAFGESAADAQTALAGARALGPTAAAEAVEQANAAWASDLVIPAGLSDSYRAFLIRSFLNLIVGTDAGSGAIVASVSRQPSYHVDWPRDGVFFNVALDLAGKHELVEKRLRFYAETMRTEPVRPTLIINTGPPGWPGDPNARDFPAGSWEMNYYADGVPSGNIRLEIDNTALVVWNFAQHAGWIDDEAARREYLEEFWPTIEIAADWLAEWRDPETGLIWPSNEDDHIEYTQGMQGSGTAFLALEASAMVATELGHTDAAERWITRARELHAAILAHLWDPDARRFDSQPPWSERTVNNATEWIGWPIQIVPWDNDDLRAQVAEGVERHLAAIRGETSRGQYPTKAAISAALVIGEGEPLDAASEIAETLAVEIAHPTTQMVGEVYVNDDVDGDGVTDRRLNVQGNPHLWSASLVYITARAVHSPEDFDRYRDVLPAVDVRTDFVTDSPGDDVSGMDMGVSADAAPRSDVDGPPSLADAQIGGGGSCACRTAAPRRSVGSLVLLMLSLLVTFARRQRR